MTVQAIAAEMKHAFRNQPTPTTRRASSAASYSSIAARAATTAADSAATIVAPKYDLPEAFSFDPFKVNKWKVVAGGDPGYLVATPMTRISGGGWRVGCRGCGRQFESSGLAYCKPMCRQASAERAEAATLMAQIGMDAPTPKRPCQAPGCTGTIPRWRNGRQVSKRAKYCDRHS